MPPTAAERRLRKAGYGQCPVVRLAWHPIRGISTMDRRCEACGRTIPTGKPLVWVTMDTTMHGSCFEKEG